MSERNPMRSTVGFVAGAQGGAPMGGLRGMGAPSGRFERPHTIIAQTIAEARAQVADDERRRALGLALGAVSAARSPSWTRSAALRGGPIDQRTIAGPGIDEHCVGGVESNARGGQPVASASLAAPSRPFTARRRRRTLPFDDAVLREGTGGRVILNDLIDRPVVPVPPDKSHSHTRRRRPQPPPTPPTGAAAGAASGPVRLSSSGAHAHRRLVSARTLPPGRHVNLTEDFAVAERTSHHRPQPPLLPPGKLRLSTCENGLSSSDAAGHTCNTYDDGYARVDDATDAADRCSTVDALEAAGGELADVLQACRAVVDGCSGSPWAAVGAADLSLEDELRLYSMATVALSEAPTTAADEAVKVALCECVFVAMPSAASSLVPAPVTAARQTALALALRCVCALSRHRSCDKRLLWAEGLAGDLSDREVGEQHVGNGEPSLSLSALVATLSTVSPLAGASFVSAMYAATALANLSLRGEGADGAASARSAVEQLLRVPVIANLAGCLTLPAATLTQQPSVWAPHVGTEEMGAAGPPSDGEQAAFLAEVTGVLYNILSAADEDREPRSMLRDMLGTFDANNVTARLCGLLRNGGNIGLHTCTAAVMGICRVLCRLCGHPHALRAIVAPPADDAGTSHVMALLALLRLHSTHVSLCVRICFVLGALTDAAAYGDNAGGAELHASVMGAHGTAIAEALLSLLERCGARDEQLSGQRRLLRVHRQCHLEACASACTGGGDDGDSDDGDGGEDELFDSGDGADLADSDDEDFVAEETPPGSHAARLAYRRRRAIVRTADDLLTKLVHPLGNICVLGGPGERVAADVRAGVLASLLATKHTALQRARADHGSLLTAAVAAEVQREERVCAGAEDTHRHKAHRRAITEALAEAAADAAASEELVLQLVCCITNLLYYGESDDSDGAENAVVRRRDDIVPALAALLFSENEEMVCECVRAFGNLSRSADFRHEMRSLRLDETAVVLLDHANLDVVGGCCGVLLNCASDSASCALFYDNECDAVARLSSVMHRCAADLAVGQGCIAAPARRLLPSPQRNSATNITMDGAADPGVAAVIIAMVAKVILNLREAATAPANASALRSWLDACVLGDSDAVSGADEFLPRALKCQFHEVVGDTLALLTMSDSASAVPESAEEAATAAARAFPAFTDSVADAARVCWLLRVALVARRSIGDGRRMTPVYDELAL